MEVRYYYSLDDMLAWYGMCCHHVFIRASYAYIQMDADHLDVCGMYNMEFERLHADLCRLQSETIDLTKRIQRATPYDIVNEFGTKLQTLCEMLKYTLERLRESPHHPWRQTPTMQIHSGVRPTVTFPHQYY